MMTDSFTSHNCGVSCLLEKWFAELQQCAAIIAPVESKNFASEKHRCLLNMLATFSDFHTHPQGPTTLVI